MSRFRFVLVQGGRVTASVEAPDIREATRLLRPPVGAWVTSAASFALGHAAPLPVTKCRGCGVRPRGKTSGYCTACTNARRRARDAEGEPTIRRRGPSLKVASRPPSHRAAIADGMRRRWREKRGEE